MGIINYITSILYIPYVFTPLVLLICLLSCIIVIRYNSLRDEDVMFVIFAVVVCVLIKTSTISILGTYISPINQPVFIYAYFSIQLLRNMICLFQLKLDEQCYYSPAAFVANFSTIGFIVFMPIYIVLFCTLIFKCISLAPSITLPITIPEFIIIPIEVIYVIYNYGFIYKRCYDNQWSKRYIKHFFTKMHFDFITIGCLFIHYTVLLIYTWGQRLMGIWISFQILRIGFVSISKIKTVQKYFNHLVITLKICDVNEGECSICYSRLKRKCVSFSCGHKFHYSCVIPWLQHNSVCPLCKQPILQSKTNYEKYIMKLPKSSRFIVRLYQFLFKQNTVQEQIGAIKEVFPMIPDGVILQDLERFSTSTDVIAHYIDHPEIVNEYTNIIANEQETHQHELVPDFDIMKNLEGIEEDSTESSDENINLEELNQINELRKRKLIEDNL
ncbi:zinc finger domain containing protein [Entamoeba histolytica KU27]|uniref:Zinc finger domain containing protein n=1 Tax=Entamoeba histolytica KU27 TaxID=885311 RepID=M2SFN5_ENTHI|nr:zinc finger domain containing protein [Entamoeba histolytica KU27]